MASYQNLSSNTVCDTCRRRKVKCDRNDPCGNCQDSNIKCIRTPSSLRRVRDNLKRHRSVESEPTPRTTRQNRYESTHSPPEYTASLPHSPSMIEAHEFIRREMIVARNMTPDKLAVLNSAMAFVNHLSHFTRPSTGSRPLASRVVDSMEEIIFPSTELLYWMIRELRSNNMGPHVLDYFKHVSPSSLKKMGLSLINKDQDAETLLLYSICVNSAAFKFINTILSVDEVEGMEESLRDCATRHLESIKLAMNRIHLLAAPSMLYLQALLCSSFIAQGIGDSASCWTFISAACKTCEDLNLETKVSICQDETENSLELYYCFIWCHILDKSYSMMLGRSRCLLGNNGLDSAFSSPLNHSMSSLLSTYLQFAPIQSIFVSELHPERILNNTSLIPHVEEVVTDLHKRLQRIHARITELNEPSDSWDGLYMTSELSTIQFSYHSLRTSILRSTQICTPGKPYIDKDCLDSARMAMSTLRSIQVEAFVGIPDIRAHVSFMHWTVLYHPLTPFFVLFCHVVSTESYHDFQMLKLVASGLDELAGRSSSISKLQRLFNAFLDLCTDVVASSQPIVSSSGTGTLELNSVEVPLVSLPANEPEIPLAGNIPPAQDTSIDSFSRALPEASVDHAVEGASLEDTDPMWGLFDAQPTLEWLDADFSLFDSIL
ncbi:hypothetical protein BS50DRAFT_561642 [Corynespora cassiicola Philippines]|uniref:Zn(2)-C6 fungal-type domain-containing protein n=1 Tax=Corynespora cassiicola Philippines TaxID=1448308 RepID=A0A2T2N837_CORCC|nr:hypothetical protein BS50DRAFT_561642 [Corynespora cassiicola Philippines]